ncbi:MAG TPA: DNA gyrase inhibitor YacG [Stellaceae bacterium]|nr:DNA gyrase inhibitor YacG [Stellaceae bacterium]
MAKGSAAGSAPGPVTPIPTGRRRCPTCGKPAVPRHQPFCSGRCADIDLGRWLNGLYRVETEENPEDETEPGET